MPAPDLPPPPDFDHPRERPLHVHLHVDHVRPESLAGATVIVIDAIRASVTIAQALHAGAHAVIPCLTAEHARTRAAELRAQPNPPAKVLLGGERGGILIEGFDLDNSPASYTPARVAGATICFTTSNGTAALLHASQARRVLVGSFANARAVSDAVATTPHPVHILCSGTRADLSLDDCLPAGLMVERLVAAGRQLTTSDAPRLVHALWDSCRDNPSRTRQLMRDSRGGRNLVRIGLGADVDYCATPDTLNIVPVFDTTTMTITRA